MAEQPVIMKEKQITLVLPNQQMKDPNKVPAVGSDVKPEFSEPKKSFGQKLSKYAFGEEVANPGNYIWTSYLEPTSKRVANDIVEYFLTMIKHTFQRLLWNGKIMDKDNLVDRTSFSNYGRAEQQYQAAVKMSPVKDITFPSKAGAERVLSKLRQYGQDPQEGNCATVRAYYEESNLPELCDSTSSSSGWTQAMLDKVEVRPCTDGDGFYITLPRPIGLRARG